MKVFKVIFGEGARPLILENLNQVKEAISFEEDESYEIGTIIEIEAIEMDEKEFKNLPEWDGP